MGIVRALVAALLVPAVLVAAASASDPCLDPTPPATDRLTPLRDALRERIVALHEDGLTTSPAARALTRDFFTIPDDAAASAQITAGRKLAGRRCVRDDATLAGLLRVAGDWLVDDARDRVVHLGLRVESLSTKGPEDLLRRVRRIERGLKRAERPRRLRARFARLALVERRLRDAEAQLHDLAPDVACTPIGPQPIDPDDGPYPVADPAPPPCVLGTALGTEDVASGGLTFRPPTAPLGLVFDRFETEWLAPVGDETTLLRLRLIDCLAQRAIHLQIPDPAPGRFTASNFESHARVYPERFRSRVYEIGGLGWLEITALDLETGALAFTWYVSHGEANYDWGSAEIADFRIALPDSE